MSIKTGRVSKQIDWLLLILYLNLLIIGLTTIYATSHTPNQTPDLFDLNSQIGRQLLWTGVSLVALLFILTVSVEFWKTFAIPIYILSIVGLLLVLIFGTEIKGQQAWFNFGFFSFQPAEFAKLGTMILLSSFLSDFRTKINEYRYQFLALGILAIPVGLILLQPDAGSALVFTALLLPLYRAGMPGIYLLLGIIGMASLLLPLMFDLQPLWLSLLLISLLGLMFQIKQSLIWLGAMLLICVVAILGYLEGFEMLTALLIGLFYIIFAVLLWRKGSRPFVVSISIVLVLSVLLSYSSYYLFNNMLASHQQERINMWLNPDKCDPHGPLYNVLQSKLAIASGGFEGKGFQEGTITKLRYVPEQTTDFIFCAIAEEQGFIGSLALIVIFTLFVLRILQIAERQNFAFNRYYAYGFAGIIFLHFFVNLGMTMGLAPVIGIPLPFISYGGSSLLFFTLFMGILLKLDATGRKK
jgi:rod shape determining protein RodA